MPAMYQILGQTAALIMLLVSSGCSDSSTAPASQEPKVDQSGFTASLSGAVSGEVSGAGVVTYLPPKEGDPVTGVRPGYFLVANLNSERNDRREFLIIFRVPGEAQPGHYDLVTPDPLRVGENFDVRVEMVEEGRSISYQSNTEGTITLEDFAPHSAGSGDSNITGTFQFVTENSQGGQISATGTFDLPLGRRVVLQDSAYSGKGASKG